MDKACLITSDDQHDTSVKDVFDLRVIFYDGHLKFSRIPPSEKVNDFRTFAYDKIAPYSALISDAYAAVGAVDQESGDSDESEVEEESKKIYQVSTNHTSTMDNIHWRIICWWQLHSEAGYRPLLDEPCRELLNFLEKAHDSMSDAGGDTSDFDALHLPIVSGITVDVPIFKLARLYWSAKHLRLKAPLRWADELRKLLLREIDNIDTKGPEQAFRGIDFWYIWGAFRDFDEGIVDAMVAKHIDAIAHDTQPRELEGLVTGAEGTELKQRMDKIKAGQSKMTWAEKFGSGMGVGSGMGGRRGSTPSSLKLEGKTNGRSWRSQKSAISFKPQKSPLVDVTNAQDDAPKTGPMGQFTILRKDRADSLTSQPSGEVDASDKKSKGEASTPPSGMAPPGSANGGGRGGAKKKGATWGGSKRGKGQGGGRDGGGGGWRD